MAFPLMGKICQICPRRILLNFLIDGLLFFLSYKNLKTNKLMFYFEQVSVYFEYFKRLTLISSHSYFTWNEVIHGIFYFLSFTHSIRWLLKPMGISFLFNLSWHLAVQDLYAVHITLIFRIPYLNILKCEFYFCL